MNCRFFQQNIDGALRQPPARWCDSSQLVLNILSLPLLVFFLSSCAGHLAPTSSLEQPPGLTISHHTVGKGETLYSIAWRYGKDYRELAATNRIPSPYRIYPGQRLSLTGKTPVVTASTPVVKRPVATHRPIATQSKPAQKSSKSLTGGKPRSSAATSARSGIAWRWPAGGSVINRFQPNDALRKGVDIAGEKGDSVSAAADGTVIYAGSALRGYGRLLIVKHSEEFLSAYAHNHKLLVTEGAEVKAGQRIAELGSSGTDRDMLHFEIRRNGQPVDPLAYLP